jgi:SAM-dependent methyltransferase
MREEHLTHLCCPDCRAALSLEATKADKDRIREGRLVCTACESAYPIRSFIPRFAGNQNYAYGFGLEWNAHSRTQYDAHSGEPLSEHRFFDETRWPRDLEGEVVIEPGSGSGRFTEQAASTGAMVLSLDYSHAVDANYQSNGHRSNVLIVQGDILRMPFPYEHADKLFCFGVLQHTPDPHASFLSLPRHLKPGGRLVADIYAKTFAKYVLGTKYWVRPITRRLPPDKLHAWVRNYIDVMWPVSRAVRRIPRIGPALNWRLLVADYSPHVSDERSLKDWAYLNTFDMLAPRYDSPQTRTTMRKWCAEAGLTDVEVNYGHNGIEARGTRPAA